MRNLLLAAGLLGLASASALAQTAPVATYEFLTLAAAETSLSKLSQLTFAPSFQGKTLVPLEQIPNSYEKGAIAHQHNLVTINQQLEALTAAGWEFVQVINAEANGLHERQYLFRRRKP